MTKMNSFLLRRRRSIQYSGLSTIEEIRTSESYLEMSDPLGAGEGSKARSTCEYFLLDTNTFAKYRVSGAITTLTTSKTP